MAKTARGWKRTLIEADELLKEQRVRAFDVATRLCAVYDDAEAREEFKTEEALLSILDERASQLFLILPHGRSPFLDLRAMLATFPKQEQWAEGDLSKLYDAMLAEQAKTASEESAPRTRRSVTVAQFEELQEQHEATEGKLAAAQAKLTELDSLRSELASARQRIAALEAENRELRALLAEHTVLTASR